MQLLILHHMSLNDEKSTDRMFELQALSEDLRQMAVNDKEENLCYLDSLVRRNR
jgi:hypothetical protein